MCYMGVTENAGQSGFAGKQGECVGNFVLWENCFLCVAGRVNGETNAQEKSIVLLMKTYGNA